VYGHSDTSAVGEENVAGWCQAVIRTAHFMSVDNNTCDGGCKLACDALLTAATLCREGGTGCLPFCLQIGHIGNVNRADNIQDELQLAYKRRKAVVWVLLSVSY
jgi:hypothetical protein